MLFFYVCKLFLAFKATALSVKKFSFRIFIVAKFKNDVFPRLENSLLCSNINLIIKYFQSKEKISLLNFLLCFNIYLNIQFFRNFLKTQKVYMAAKFHCVIEKLLLFLHLTFFYLNISPHSFQKWIFFAQQNAPLNLFQTSETHFLYNRRSLFCVALLKIFGFLCHYSFFSAH